MACKHNFDHVILDTLDIFNSTVLPFIGMIILSIALIVCVYRSRSRMNSTSASSRTKRDNRLAISTISLNIMFLVFTLPLTFYDLFSYNYSIPEKFVFSIYYCYYGLGFYIQIIVNRDFREEFLRLLNLKVISNNNDSRMTDINHIT